MAIIQRHPPGLTHTKRETKNKTVGKQTWWQTLWLNMTYEKLLFFFPGPDKDSWFRGLTKTLGFRDWKFTGFNGHGKWQPIRNQRHKDYDAHFAQPFNTRCTIWLAPRMVQVPFQSGSFLGFYLACSQGRYPHHWLVHKTFTSTKGSVKTSIVKALHEIL